MAKLVYQRKNGKWEARFRKGVSADGKVIYGTVYGDTENEAIQRRIEHLGYDPDAINSPLEMNLLILGAGIHGRDTRQIAESLRVFKKISFLDDYIKGTDIIGKCSDAAQFRNAYPCAFVAIGDNAIRKKYASLLRQNNFLLPSLVALTANVSPEAKIGEGTAVLPRSTVNDAEIGDFCVIDLNSIVNSGSKIGDYSRIDCGSIVLRGMAVPEESWVQTGKIYGENQK